MDLLSSESFASSDLSFVLKQLLDRCLVSFRLSASIVALVFVISTKPDELFDMVMVLVVARGCGRALLFSIFFCVEAFCGLEFGFFFGILASS